MEFFNNMGKKLSDTAKAMNDKIAEASELNRMKSKLADMNKEMDKLFIQIGKAFYTARGSKESLESAEGFCQKLDALKEEAKALQREIDLKRSKARCAKCGAPLNPQAKFCFECGEKVVAETVTEEPAETEESAVEDAEDASEVTVEETAEEKTEA